MADDDSAAEAVAAATLAKSLDFVWLFACLALVIMMQAGFAAYEVGTIRTTAASSILKKNVADATISFVGWIFIGYGISEGKAAFILMLGGPFNSTDDDGDSGFLLLECLFRWSFAATCTTIVSGAVADRIYVKAYFIYASLTSALFYPYLAYLVWADDGWFSPYRESGGESDALLNCGVVDFAGSGVVHMFGGVISLVMAAVIHNRPNRFIEANPDLLEQRLNGQASRSFCPCSRFIELGTKSITTNDKNGGILNHTSVPQLNELAFGPNDESWVTLGCLLLWIGWYGFNCGSTLQISTTELRNSAGRAAMNTTIGAAVGCVSSMVFEVIYSLRSPTYRHKNNVTDPIEEIAAQIKGTEALRLNKDRVDCELQHRKSSKWHLSTQKSIHGAACNGILAGLVGITAGCATMNHWVAVGVSIISALLYHVSYRGIICCRIDDAVNASALHMACGWWGLIAAGFSVTGVARQDLGYPSEDEDGCTLQNQALVNLIMGFCIFGYGVVCAGMICGLLKLMGMLQRTREHEPKKKETDTNELERTTIRDFAAVNKRVRDVEAELKKLKGGNKYPDEEKQATDGAVNDEAVHLDHQDDHHSVWGDENDERD